MLQSIAGLRVVVSSVALDVSHAAAPYNAVNPAWPDPATSVGDFFPSLFDEIKCLFDIQDQPLMTDDLIPRLATISPGSGAYHNAGDRKQPDWQSTFYSCKYPAPVAVKQDYDPDQRFYAHAAVGSED
ncbi:FAD-linked oxidoreductase sor8 [Penicillium canariense]|uniref:FAD-linked oxidoreductase sor8 n=1 Tax=Penicillium canariense TaxID=189055 RepID=A0A9W9I8N3_9EURO|nr:FAD-linked oxidoreductase sor8 [Penicillium canariense]KAJ5168590.1 FAD-linked oxidoreductase sor8 [Penicillium canariense]